MGENTKKMLLSIVSKTFLAAALTGAISSVISPINGILHLLIGIIIGAAASIIIYHELKKHF